ncbi:hypothetical protein BS47DRAFT_490599 [Hydnum rufescens UP504]|uniref:Uncharacterized protein n=1 Tax=Hydnum rufescens UP504 TaxID=1448309 RepID=A0A9P6AHL4_9AGAM|nr:hypothetical protein BS47DRAFT_490599 [Hydnum rufescens UP504]
MVHTKTSLFFAVTVSLLPALTTALVGIDWKVSNVPESGLTDIGFPFSIANAPHERVYYFAQQFQFKGQSDVGYTGLQPQLDATSDGLKIPFIRAVFSSFINGSTTTDPNCHDGADGGPGVSCGVYFFAPYADYFVLEIRNTQGTTWNGTVVDTHTTRRFHIGSYTLPAGTEGITKSQGGFIENFVPPFDCPSLHRTSVTFGIPVTSNPGSARSLSDAYQYGDCTGKMGFESHRTLEGVEVTVGFKTAESLWTLQRIAKSIFSSSWSGL